MRISVYDNPRLAFQVRCWFNGVDISDYCVEADDETGYAICYMTDAQGMIRHNHGQPLWERREGEVRFSLIPPARKN